MVYTERLKNAVRFSIKTHDLYQKQKRKGKDVSYISHPFTVGFILTKAGASEDVIIAGLLHDTIEDSIAERKVTYDMIAERFGNHVADLVESVTEKDKELSWEERKVRALERVETYSRESVLVKSADLISNMVELMYDYKKEGEVVWGRFGGPKEKKLDNTLRLISALVKQWPDSPLVPDLIDIERSIEEILKK